MNTFVTFLALSCALISVIESQPLNEASFNFIPYLNEQFNPVLKHHRARFRPFVTQLGSPIANLRTGRSINERKQSFFSLIFKCKMNKFIQFFVSILKNRTRDCEIIAKC